MIESCRITVGNSTSISSSGLDFPERIEPRMEPWIDPWNSRGPGSLSALLINCEKDRTLSSLMHVSMLMSMVAVK